jgi:hypothetical protein
MPSVRIRSGQGITLNQFLWNCLGEMAVSGSWNPTNSRKLSLTRPIGWKVAA